MDRRQARRALFGRKAEHPLHAHAGPRRPPGPRRGRYAGIACANDPAGRRVDADLRRQLRVAREPAKGRSRRARAARSGGIAAVTSAPVR